MDIANVKAFESGIPNIELCIMDVANVYPLEPAIPKIEWIFYDLDHIKKLVMIGYIFPSARMQGFRDFSYPLQISIDKDS